MSERYLVHCHFTCAAIVDSHHPEYINEKGYKGELKDAPWTVFHMYGRSLDFEDNWYLDSSDHQQLLDKAGKMNADYEKAFLPH
jgi:hypothetical protein